MNTPEHANRIRKALRGSQWDFLVCALPMNVLLLSGYWPVVGTGVAIAFANGRVSLLVPQDEEDLARSGWADEIRTFRPGSLNELLTAAQAIRAPLRELAGTWSRESVRVGYEASEFSEPASYVGMHLYGGAMWSLLNATFTGAALSPADEVLADLRGRQTNFEINKIRTACEIAGRAFQRGRGDIENGLSEVEIAAKFREPLATSLAEFPGIERAGGSVWCMSGANSALASGAYARSRAKRIDPGDLVLVHCNSYADGRWTDITRTYSMGMPDHRRKCMFEAVFAARQAAFQAIHPGARAADIDTAARNVLEAKGFGPEFKHSAGHGVGFSAIDANAKPRLHPKSEDRVEAGMVFNIEPAIYFEGYGGLRHCDMVAVTATGVELLTPFQCEIAELVIAA